MKQKLESIIKKGKVMALTGIMSLASLTLSSQSLKHYAEPRIGLIAPMAAQEQKYNPSFLMGGACGFNVGKIGFEAGLDYFHSSGEDIKTNSILPKINVSYSPLKQKKVKVEPYTQEVKVEPYAMAGINLLSEFSAIDIPEFDVHDKISNTTFGVEFGVGATIVDKINGRITYTMMPASENIKGIITLTAGYRFLFGGKTEPKKK